MPKILDLDAEGPLPMVSTRVPVTVRDALDRRAAADGVKRSVVIRRALVAVAAREEAS
jgi:hypothetical protein